MTVTYHAGKRIQGLSTDNSKAVSFNTSTETGFTISGNTITKDSGSNAWGDSKVQSNETFTVGTAFGFDFSPIDSGGGYIGLGQGTLSANTSGQQQFPDSMVFGLYISNESKVVEATNTGTAKNIQSSFNTNDVYRISVSAGGTVRYYRQASGSGDFNLEYTSLTTASGTYYIQANNYVNTKGFNSVTSGKPTNVQTGSRYEETDTHRIYIKDDVSFKLLKGAEATNYRSESWYEQLSGEKP